MNIVLRKLIYNDCDIYLINWNERPCFIVSEISGALDGVSKEDIQLFLRNSSEVKKGIDYDIVQGADARTLRSNLEDSGVKKRFAHTMIIYLAGLNKYFDFRRTRPVKEFYDYLRNNKINLEDSTPPDLPIPPIAAEPTKPDIQNPKSTRAKQHTDMMVNAANYIGYSDLVKHISFMEDFVDTINKLNISPDKSIAFTKDMAKFLEDNSLPAEKLLTQLKKWI